MVFQLRTERDPLSLAPTVEKTVHAISPQLPVFQMQTMREGLYTANGLLLFQIGASIAAIMGFLGLTLAVIGLYGVISYTVGCRVHEIGLRMALGASRGTVFRMIYRRSLVIIAGGLATGLALALLVAKGVGSFVVVNVWSPGTYAGVVIVLALAALLSCYAPAPAGHGSGTHGGASRRLIPVRPRRPAISLDPCPLDFICLFADGSASVDFPVLLNLPGPTSQDGVAAR